MRLVVPFPLHSGEPSSVWLCSIDPEVSKMTRMFGRSDWAWTGRDAAAAQTQNPSAATTRGLPLNIAAVSFDLGEARAASVRLRHGGEHTPSGGQSAPTRRPFSAGSAGHRAGNRVRRP